MDELIKTSSFGENKILKIQDQQLVFNSSKIQLQAVTQFKYDVEPIQLDMFYVGRKFVIELKSDEGHVKVVFKSYLGFSKTYFNNLFSEILKSIWQDTAIRIIEKSIDKIVNGGIVVVGKCGISKEGITYNNFLITWSDLSYRKNYNNLTINSKSNSKIWTNLYYIQEYNVDVLMAVLDWIYKHDGLEEIKKGSVRRTM